MIRNYTRPDAFISSGLGHTLKTKLFWAMGPQLIGGLIGVMVADNMFGQPPVRRATSQVAQVNYSQYESPYGQVVGGPAYSHEPSRAANEEDLEIDRKIMLDEGGSEVSSYSAESAYNPEPNIESRVEKSDLVASYLGEDVSSRSMEMESQEATQRGAMAVGERAGTYAIDNSNADTSGPSFDCAKASTVVEHRICQTPVLAQLDKELANTFSGVRRGLIGSESRRSELLKSQQEWMRERNGCGGDTACLKESYLQRIDKVCSTDLPIDDHPGCIDTDAYRQ